MTEEASQGFGRIAAVYLIGLLLGGLYVGLIAPLRTVIQADMGVDNSLGIWMVNVYTLFYASTIPTTGKLADRYGRKRVFTWCMGIFSVGALLCGLAQFAGGFPLLIVGRVVQAIGAGGIIPVATAEMGASAPEGKRGMWLGMAAATAGISNVVGAAVGSGIVAIAGVDNWCWAFFIAAPVGLLLILGARAWLPHREVASEGKLDVVGSILFTVMILALLHSLFAIENAGFESIRTIIPLALFVVLVPVFRAWERRASDPIFHLEYLHNPRIVITMVVSFLVGCVIISMVLIPEFAEAALDLPLGSGGFYMAIMGIFAIVGPPVGGKIIDKRGAKPVLVGGLGVTALGFALLAFVVAPNPSVVALVLGLAVVGLGMGFAMGTPLNYMILENTSSEDSSSAIATIALIRQVGTTVAPAFLISLAVTGMGGLGYQAQLAAIAIINIVAVAIMLFYQSPSRD